MTRRVLFNGAVLVRAGGATKIDASAFQNLGLGGVGNVGLVGEADAGEPNVVKLFRDPKAGVEEYGVGPLADAMDLAFQPMNDVRVPGGANLVLARKVNQGTQSTLALSESATLQMTLTSKTFGVDANKITYEQTTSGTGKIVELKFEKGIADVITETSPVLGENAEFTVTYTGAGTAATLTITDTALTTTITGGPGGEDLNLLFTTFPTLNELINAINNAVGGVYTAVAITTNPFAFLNVDLDRVTTVDIDSPVTGSFKAVLFRMIEFITDNSSLVTAVRAAPTDGTGAPDNTVGAVPLAGGTRGTSTNTDWQDGFDDLGKVRANQIVGLISEDLSVLGQGSTATFVAVAAQADAHSAFFSSTKGKSERQTFIGMKGTKTAILAQAGVLQSPHTLLTGQQVTRANAQSDLVKFPEWGMAVVAAGGRAGSDLGEPLVFKNLRSSGLDQDASWNPDDDGEDLILGGVSFAFAPPNRGFKFDRMVTTYTKADNDAFVEESVVQGWKTVSFDLRTQLEDIYTGTKGTPASVRAIEDSASTILELFRKEGQIVDSIDAEGNLLKAYRELKVSIDGDIASLSVVISPVSGINFTLNTLFLVKAVIAA